jgi:hypothetical protein
MTTSPSQASVAADPAPTTEPVYRDGTLGVLRQRDALLESYREQLTEVSPELRTLYARRIGRIAAGVAAASTMAVLAICTFDLEVSLTPFIGVAWALAGLALVVGRVLGARAFDRRLRAAAQPGADPLRDIDRLGRETPERRARDMLARHERAGLGAPLVGLSLLLPLTIHLAVFGMVGAPGGVSSFDLWIRMSAFLVGFAHVALASMAWALAGELTRGEARPLRYNASNVIGYTTLAGCVPGVIAIGLPPIIVAVTALLFVPLIFAWATGAARHERSLTVMVDCEELYLGGGRRRCTAHDSLHSPAATALPISR